MDQTRTGQLIRRLREEKGLTQKQLAERLGVSDKAVSKWERGMGSPDVSLIAGLAGQLGIQPEALLAGELNESEKEGENMKKSSFYVCPVCGNIVMQTGCAAIACCGRQLEPLNPQKAEESDVTIEQVEDELFVSFDHEMTKEHRIAFAACVYADRAEIIKLYPEWNAELRIRRRACTLIWYCTVHGAFCKRIVPIRDKA